MRFPRPVLALAAVASVCGGILWCAQGKLRQPESFRAALITDIDHCVSRQSANFGQLEAFLRQAKEGQADFVASLGDNASHRLGACSETADQEARLIADKLRSGGLPAYFVLGDHDIASDAASYRAWLETIGRERTFYSFDAKGVHVVVLDTVLGGDPLSPPCEEAERCRALEARVRQGKERAGGGRESFSAEQREELRALADALEQERSAISETRSSGSRDKGRVGEAQLAWLEQDLRQAKPGRLLVLSDHPLFPFSSERKTYATVNAERVRSLVKASGKEAVFVSGEAHLWHEERFEGLPFYIIDEFRKAGGSWAIFQWDDEGHRLERVTHE